MKMRNRTGIWRAAGLAVAVLLVSVSGACSRKEGAGTKEGASQEAAATEAVRVPFSISKDTTGITSPLNADGSPDYVGAINEKYGKGVTAENNGYVVYQTEVLGTQGMPVGTRDAVLAMMGAGVTPEGARVRITFGEFLKTQKNFDAEKVSAHDYEYEPARGQMWEEKDHPELAEYLRYVEKPLDNVADAVARPRWWSPYVSRDGRTVVMVSLPSLGAARDVAEVLAARATWRAGQGDWDGFSKDVVTIKRLGRHIAMGFTPIERQVGYVMDRMANDAIGTVAGSGKMSAEQSAALTKELDGLSAMPGMIEAVDVGQRWDLLDVVTLAATGDGTFSAAVTGLSSGLTGGGADVERLLWSIQREEVDWDVVLKRVNELTNEMVAAMKAPTMGEMRVAAGNITAKVERWKQAAGPSLEKGDKETRKEYSERVAAGMAGVMGSMVPTMANAEQSRREAVMHGEMTGALLAAAGVKAKTGAWPKTLEELVPTALKEVPRDVDAVPGSGTVRYVVNPAGPRVYSVGRDGVDQGGKKDAALKLDDIGVGPG